MTCSWSALVTVLRLRGLFCVLLAAGIAVPAWAARAPLSKEQLQSKAELILIGTVQSYRTETRPAPDYEERTYVELDVLVESVEKGNAKVGEVAQVLCWRLTRQPFFVMATDAGQFHIPSPGSRAKFFLQGETALHPNGIELLEGAAPLALSMRSPWSVLVEWPLVLIPLGGITLLALVAALIYRKQRAKRTAP